MRFFNIAWCNLCFFLLATITLAMETNDYLSQMPKEILFIVTDFIEVNDITHLCQLNKALKIKLEEYLENSYKKHFERTDLENNWKKIYFANLKKVKTNLAILIAHPKDLPKINRYFVGIKLKEKNFNNRRLGCPCHPVNFSNATFTDIDLSQSRLPDASFKNAVFIRCTFSEANLHSCNFTNARFIKTNLRGAYVEKAKFKNADLSGALMEGAHIYGSHSPMPKINLEWLKQQEAIWDPANPPIIEIY